MAVTRQAPNGRDPIELKARDRRPEHLARLVEDAEEFYQLRGYRVTWTEKKDGEWRGVAAPQTSPPESLTSEAANLALWKKLPVKRQRALLEVASGCEGSGTRAEDANASKDTLEELRADGFLRFSFVPGLYGVVDGVFPVLHSAVKAGLVRLAWRRCGCAGHAKFWMARPKPASEQQDTP
jgi:hypothetical protein